MQVDYVNNIVKNTWNLGTADKPPTNRRESADKPPTNIKQYQTNRKLDRMLKRFNKEV
jgi:hypothetical protein